MLVGKTVFPKQLTLIVKLLLMFIYDDGYVWNVLYQNLSKPVSNLKPFVHEHFVEDLYEISTCH